MCSAVVPAGSTLNATCNGTADCSFVCERNSNCNRVGCGNNASCLLDCAPQATCSFDGCQAELSCPNGVIVCNRDCP